MVYNYFNTNISYNIYGSGINVVLLHGFGEDSNTWKYQTEYLKDKCKLIVIDVPGSGDSDLIHGLSEAVTIEDYATYIHAVLQHEDVHECIMLGHSMGGYITMAFARLYPKMLKGFGLIHSSAAADSEEKKQTRKKGIEFMEEHGAYLFLKTSIPGLFGEKYNQTNSAEVDSFIEDAKAITAEASIQYCTAMMNRPDTTHVLKSSEIPVIFILGTEDNAAPVKDVLPQTAMPKQSYIHILEGAGHMGHWEQHEKVNSYLLSFINDISNQ